MATNSDEEIIEKRASSPIATSCLVISGLALLAGLSVYAYLPLVYLTEPAFNYAGHYGADGLFRAVDLTTVRGLWWLVSGQTFSGQMLAYGGGGAVLQAGHFGAQLWRAFVAIGVGPGLLGVAVLWRTRRPVNGLLLLIFLIHSGFYVNYAVGDKDTMFLPSYLIWALWVGVGYEWLLQWVGQHRTPRYLSSPATARLIRYSPASSVTSSRPPNSIAVSGSGLPSDVATFPSRTTGSIRTSTSSSGIAAMPIVCGWNPDTSTMSETAASSHESCHTMVAVPAADVLRSLSAIVRAAASGVRSSPASTSTSNVGGPGSGERADSPATSTLGPAHDATTNPQPARISIRFRIEIVPMGRSRHRCDQRARCNPPG